MQPHTTEMKKATSIYFLNAWENTRCSEIISRVMDIFNEMLKISEVNKEYAQKLENWASNEEGCSTVFLRDILLPETSYNRDSRTSYGIRLDWNAFITLDSIKHKWIQYSFAQKEIYYLHQKNLSTEKEEREFETEKRYMRDYKPYRRFCSYNPNASYWN